MKTMCPHDYYRNDFVAIHRKLYGIIIFFAAYLLVHRSPIVTHLESNIMHVLNQNGTHGSPPKTS